LLKRSKKIVAWGGGKRTFCYRILDWTALDLSNNININKYIQKDKYAYLWIWIVFALIVGQE